MRELLIIGGGIGGLATALAARAGRRVHVIEKAPAFAEIGAGCSAMPRIRMVQYIAPGACQPLEDAVCLGRVLETQPDLRAAFLQYERERVPRTARVQQMARFFADIKHLDGAGH